MNLKAIKTFLARAYDLFKTVNNTILMGLLYFVILCPAGIARKLVGASKVQKKIDLEASTYFEVPKKLSADHKNPF